MAGIFPISDGGAWKGTDWGNLLSVTPEPVLDAHDPRVTATSAKCRHAIKREVATYAEPDDGQFLHHYLTVKNTLTELVRGDQDQAIREFYAELLIPARHMRDSSTQFAHGIARL